MIIRSTQMAVKKETNQTDGCQPTHIILSVDYETKLIIPIEKGLEFIHIWATARELKEPYNKPKIIQAVEKDFQLRFVTDHQIRKMEVENMLETNGNED